MKLETIANQLVIAHREVETVTVDAVLANLVRQEMLTSPDGEFSEVQLKAVALAYHRLQIMLGGRG